MQMIDNWLGDLPQQFHGKEKIEALIAAFARQLQEIQDAFDDLENLTDIDTATGQNLDMVGNIVSLTRKEATSIVRKASDTLLTDDIYRQALRYKMLKNSSDCCYEDIMGAVALVWDTGNIAYKEPADRPATVLLSLSAVSLDSIDPAIGKVLAIKPAGVAVIYTVEYWSIIPFCEYEKFLVPKINLSWKLPFYDFAMKNAKKLDGTWILDGTTLFGGQMWRVPMLLGMHMGHAISDETADLSDIAARFSFRHSDETMALDSVESSVKIQSVSAVDAKAKITAEIDYKSDISCSLITRKNMWYLDGSQLLDGNRYFNATEIKEVI